MFTRLLMLFALQAWRLRTGLTEARKGRQGEGIKIFATLAAFCSKDLWLRLGCAVLSIALTDCVLAKTLAGAEGPAAAAPTSVAELVKQLDADEFTRREEASRRLTELGIAAVPELAQAAQQRSVEVSTRAFAILKEFVTAEDEALRAKTRQALKEIAARRETAEKNKDDALATAAATATAILGRPFIGLYGHGAAMGALVADVVEGSPAEKAGLQAGDVVLSFGGVPTPTFQALIAAVGNKEPGDRTKVEINRDGEKIEFDLIVGRY